MRPLIAIIIIGLGIKVSIQYQGLNIHQFWDLIAFSIVVIGTFALGIMTIPSMKIKHILSIFFRGISGNQGLREDCIGNAINLIKGNRFTHTKCKRIDQRILVDGHELMQIGLSTEKLKSLLQERITKYLEDGMTVSNWLKGLSKYPPALGLAATILGLIHLMHGLGTGSSPKETGIRMSIALIATFYGVIVANVILSPLGDRLNNNLIEDEKLALISLEAVVLIPIPKINYGPMT